MINVPEARSTHRSVDRQRNDRLGWMGPIEHGQQILRYCSGSDTHTFSDRNRDSHTYGNNNTQSHRYTHFNTKSYTCTTATSYTGASRVKASNVIRLRLGAAGLRRDE